MTNFYHSVMKNCDMTRTSLWIFACKATCHGIFLVFVDLSFEEILCSLVVFNIAELGAAILALRKKLNYSGIGGFLTLISLIGIMVMTAIKGDVSAGGFGWWMVGLIVWAAVAFKALGHDLRKLMLRG